MMPPPAMINARRGISPFKEFLRANKFLRNKKTYHLCMWRSAVVFCGFIDAGENAEVKRLGVYKKNTGNN